MRSDLPVAGLEVIEAETLEEAARMVAKSPCPGGHGVVEVWPLQQAAAEAGGVP